VDTRTGVNDADYQVPFHFTGTLKAMTLKLGRPQMAAADWNVIQERLATTRD